MIKWCVIGAGGIADRRAIPALLEDNENVLVALMERDVQVGEMLSKKYGVKCYNNEEEMLKNEDCDAVYIGTPVSCHYDQAMLSLKYGKHVFIEKPIALNAKQGQEMLDAFKKAKKQLFIGYMMKYHNLHQTARKIVSQGEIGQISSIRLQFTCWYPEIKGAWRQAKALGGGGAIIDLGVHCFELAEYLLGEEIVETKSFYDTRTFSYEVEDSAIIAFKTKNGVLGHVDVSFNVPDKASSSKLEIYGTKGNIICTGTLAQEEVGKLAYLFSPQGDYDAGQTRVSVKPIIKYGKKNNLYLKQIRHFNDLIKKGICDYYYAEKAVHIQEIVDGIYAGK